MSQPLATPPADRSDEPTPTNAHAIARLSVDGLFGKYRYELASSGTTDVRELSRLFIMYGANGSGKTTLLQLIYHALSPAPNKGHRTFLAHTRFKRLAIEFFDGTVLEVDRKFEGKSGSLLLTLHRNARTLAGAELEIDDELNIPSSENLKQRERHDEFLASLQQFGITLYYLSDDRRHQGDLGEVDQTIAAHQTINSLVSGTTRILYNYANHTPIEYIENPAKSYPRATNVSLKAVMARVVAWVQHEARRNTAKGEGDVYGIYSKVIGDIAHSFDPQSGDMSVEVKRIIAILPQLENKSRQYSQYGLTPSLPVDELIRSVRQANAATLPILTSVMKPYVEGIHARLVAMDRIYQTIHRFIGTMNAFYQDKQVLFHVDKGFMIRSGKEWLDPSLLSSGEQQLFMLLCNTVLAKGHASLFLIDEPELSLNVEWQRQLVDALLRNTEGSSVQFIMATHSMELVTQHRSSVARLVDLAREAKGNGDKREGRDETGEA